MIYLFHGSNVEAVRTKAFEWVAAAHAKEPKLMYTRLVTEDLTENALMEAAGAGGLFVKRLLILIDNPFEKTRITKEKPSGTSDTVFEKYLDILASSDNAIVVLAPALSVAQTKKLLEKAKKEYRFDYAYAQKTRGFNSALVNALSERDSKKLWLEVMRTLYAGDSPEMLHGLLHWKARDLMAKGSRVWSAQEARALSLSLITLLGDTRRTGVPLALKLERFALSI